MTNEKTIIEAKISQAKCGNGTQMHTEIRLNGNVIEIIESTAKILNGIYNSIREKTPEAAENFRDIFMEEDFMDMIFTEDKKKQAEKAEKAVNNKEEELLSLLKELKEMMEDND